MVYYGLIFKKQGTQKTILNKTQLKIIIVLKLIKFKNSDLIENLKN